MLGRQSRNNKSLLFSFPSYANMWRMSSFLIYRREVEIKRPARTMMYECAALEVWDSDSKCKMMNGHVCADAICFQVVYVDVRVVCSSNLYQLQFCGGPIGSTAAE